MPTIVKINSKLGMVNFNKEDMAEFGLLKWIRTDSKGFHHRCFIDQQPFEKAASHVFHEKYPSSSVKIADKIILGQDGSVDVFLRITNDFSRGYYNSHPTKLTFSHSKGTKLDDDAKDYTEVFDYSEFDVKKSSSESIDMKDLRDVVAAFFDEDNSNDDPSIDDIEKDKSQVGDDDIERIVDEALEELKDDLVEKIEFNFGVSEKSINEEIEDKPLEKAASEE